MRDFLALGMVGCAVLAGLAACGDDEANNRPGLGGAGGSAGGAGTAGSSGAGGSLGGAGGGGGGTPLPPPPPPPDVTPQATCTGCVELITPVVGPRSPDNVADEASYIFGLGAPVDFTNGVITWRIAAVQPNANYTVVLFAQNGQELNFAGAYSETVLDPAVFPANQFRDVVLDLTGVASVADAGVPDAGDAADAGVAGDAGDAGLQPVSPPPTIIDAFDKSQIIQIGLFVGVNEGFSGSATVRVAVDQVSVAGVPGQPERTFTTGTDGLAINPYNTPPGTPPPTHHP